MGQIIDISAKITNELPKVCITSDLIVTVNNRKSTILNIKAMTEEQERKGEEYDELKYMDKAMSMLIGAKATKAIDEMDLPFPEYKEVFNTVFSVASGENIDTP